MDNNTSFMKTNVKDNIIESFTFVERQLKESRNLLLAPMTFESCENFLLRIAEAKSILIDIERIVLKTHFESCIVPQLKTPVEIILALHNLSIKRFGALIVIERETNLEAYIKTRTIINAEVSAPLLESIFYPGNPLHDGAAIVRDNRIIAAKALLPVADGYRTSIPKSLGSRHRAAVGLSEISDALVIVVSEQTGHISLAVKGQLHYGLGIATLRSHLRKI